MPTIKIYGYNEPGLGLNLYTPMRKEGTGEEDMKRISIALTGSGGTNLASSPQLGGTLSASAAGFE